MMPISRGAVVIVRDDHVALIERVNDRGVYYIFPGGAIEAGESVAEAAAREAKEELGLDVRVTGLLGVVEFKGREQHYFAADIVGGEFGTGTGEELFLTPDSKQGTYRPVWVPVAELLQRNVRPPVVVDTIIGATEEGAAGAFGPSGKPWRIVEEA